MRSLIPLHLFGKPTRVLDFGAEAHCAVSRHASVFPASAGGGRAVGGVAVAGSDSMEAEVASDSDEIDCEGEGGVSVEDVGVFEEVEVEEGVVRRAGPRRTQENRECGTLERLEKRE